MDDTMTGVTTAPIQRTSARVIPVNASGRVLLLHGHDPARPESSYWFTIGGAVESGESLAAAAVRELWEETGIEITEQRLGLPYHRGTHAFSYDGVDLSPMKASSRCDWTTSRLASTESKATR